MEVVDDALLERARARIGNVLRGKYRIDRVLGVGGMAAVYAATHRNGHQVAIKMLHAELSMRSDIRMRFVQEGLAANAVKHRGVVIVTDDDIDESGAAFLVMELLHGKVVEDVWQKNGRRLPPKMVLALGRELCAVLAAAHRAGIVHRDIKPENLFLTRDGDLKVLDFGLAHLRDLTRPRQTTSGMVFGTPAFMPPEQANGLPNEIDAQSDLWAVGATMFTLLSGETVHDGKSAQHYVILAATQPARSLARVIPEREHIAPQLVALVDRALAREKRDRWRSAEAMAAAICDASIAVVGEPWPDLELDDHTRVGAFSPELTALIRPHVVADDAGGAGGELESTIDARRGKSSEPDAITNPIPRAALAKEAAEDAVTLDVRVPGPESEPKPEPEPEPDTETITRKTPQRVVANAPIVEMDFGSDTEIHRPTFSFDDATTHVRGSSAKVEAAAKSETPTEPRDAVPTAHTSARWDSLLEAIEPRAADDEELTKQDATKLLHARGDSVRRVLPARDSADALRARIPPPGDSARMPVRSALVREPQPAIAGPSSRTMPDLPPLVLGLLLGGLVFLVVIGGFLVLRNSSNAAAKPAATVATAVAPSVVSAAPSIAPSVSAPPSELAIIPSATSEPVLAEPTPSTAPPPPPPKPVASARKTNECDPPWTIDAQGVKVVKIDCLLNQRK